MKECGTTHWMSPNTGAINSSGLTGLPGGLRGAAVEFTGIGIGFDWWSSTGNNNAVRISGLFFQDAKFCKAQAGPNDGLFVRCVKD
jgi:hypothetical protein